MSRRNKIITRLILTAVIALMLISWSSDLLAQCPMCRIAAESNLKGGGTAGKGLNGGILYMLAAPYVLVAVSGYIWYTKIRKHRQDDLSESIG